MASIKVEKSRFALLKVEDDDSDDAQQKSSQQSKGNQQKNAQKKKNKKKKQQQAQTEAQQLKHLAFGAPIFSEHGVQPSSATNRQTNGSHSNAPEAQWSEWQKLDKEYAQDAFEKDLQQAMLLSKLDNEQVKQQGKNQITSQTDGSGGGDAKDSKKKKKKDKPQTISLEEFNNQEQGKKTHADELDVLNPPSSITKLPSGEKDTKFFKTVESDVSRILRQEKMQEEYTKQFAAESVITAKYQDQIKKMEKEVEFLRATMKKQEEELGQVKKRNKQLCVILAQGEMKDKAEVLMQVDQLTEVKDELTAQVAELTAELEKERSKVHSLKTEVDKYKVEELLKTSEFEEVSGPEMPMQPKNAGNAP